MEFNATYFPNVKRKAVKHIFHAKRKGFQLFNKERERVQAPLKRDILINNSKLC